MSAETIVTMVLILGFVWGGFALILGTSVRREREKSADGETGPA